MIIVTLRNDIKKYLIKKSDFFNIILILKWLDWNNITNYRLSILNINVLK